MDKILVLLTSRTIIAALVSVAAGIASIVGKQIDPAMQGGIVDLVLQIGSVVSAAAAIFFRANPQAQLGSKKPE